MPPSNSASEIQGGPIWRDISGPDEGGFNWENLLKKSAGRFEEAATGCRAMLSLDFSRPFGPLFAHLTRGLNARYLAIEAQGLKKRAEAGAGLQLAKDVCWRITMNKRFKLLAVLPHPDDESLGFGGTLAKYADEGVETYLVTATREERGRFGSLGKGGDPVEAGRIREGELRAAAAELGIREVSTLGYPSSFGGIGYPWKDASGGVD